MMKYFKSLILLGLLLGSVVLVSSAAEAETSKDEKKWMSQRKLTKVAGDTVAGVAIAMAATLAADIVVGLKLLISPK
ncbi:hypothetical protein ACFX2A_024726 [Malus domestica]